MKIHEYQAKALLREFGVPVPNGDVADTPAKAREIAQRLGGRVVVKAQVHAGGRGKGGGIKLADDPAGAEAAAKADPRHEAQDAADAARGHPGPLRSGSRRPRPSIASSTSR